MDALCADLINIITNLCKKYDCILLGIGDGSDNGVFLNLVSTKSRLKLALETNNIGWIHQTFHKVDHYMAMIYAAKFNHIWLLRYIKISMITCAHLGKILAYLCINQHNKLYTELIGKANVELKKSYSNDSYRYKMFYMLGKLGFDLKNYREPHIESTQEKESYALGCFFGQHYELGKYGWTQEMCEYIRNPLDNELCMLKFKDRFRISLYKNCKLVDVSIADIILLISANKLSYLESIKGNFLKKSILSLVEFCYLSNNLKALEFISTRITKINRGYFDQCVESIKSLKDGGDPKTIKYSNVINEIRRYLTMDTMVEIYQHRCNFENNLDGLLSSVLKVFLIKDRLNIVKIILKSLMLNNGVRLVGSCICKVVGLKIDFISSLFEYFYDRIISTKEPKPYSKMKELKEIAKQMHIEGFKHMKKEQLLLALIMNTY